MYFLHFCSKAVKIFTCPLRRKKQVCGSLPLRGCLLEFVSAAVTSHVWLSVNIREPYNLSVLSGCWGGPVCFISNNDLSSLMWILRGPLSLADNWNPHFLLTSLEGESWTKGEDRRKFSLRSWNNWDNYFPGWGLGPLRPWRLVRSSKERSCGRGLQSEGVEESSFSAGPRSVLLTHLPSCPLIFTSAAFSPTPPQFLYSSVLWQSRSNSTRIFNMVE